MHAHVCSGTHEIFWKSVNSAFWSSWLDQSSTEKYVDQSYVFEKNQAWLVDNGYSASYTYMIVFL